MILEALKYAEMHHSGQVRKVSNEPYFSHPLMVSYLLARYKRSHKFDHMIAAALLHDTVEDTAATHIEINTLFGPLVSSLVHELTSDPEEIKELGKVEYLKRKMVGISSWGLTIKLVDRLANILDSPTEKTLHDTIDILAYLSANRRLSKSQEAIKADILSEIDKRLRAPTDGGSQC